MGHPQLFDPLSGFLAQGYFDRVMFVSSSSTGKVRKF